MTSLQTSTRQVGTSGFYINVASLVGKIYTSPVNSSGVPSTVSTAAWGSTGAPGGSSAAYITSTLNTTGGAILRDMGKTAISSGVYFRKVQLVVPQGSAYFTGATSTFGVSGNVGNGGDYLTGYIQLGFEGGSPPAPVAKFGV